MLKGISPLLSPELLKALDEMGHGDTLVIPDGNFPAESIGKNAKVIRADGHGVPELLERMPVDVILMPDIPDENRAAIEAAAKKTERTAAAATAVLLLSTLRHLRASSSVRCT